MTIYDLSLPISESFTVWPGDSPVRMVHTSHLDRGDSWTITSLEMGTHTGTHVDAPAHFLLGAEGVDALDLDVLVGPAQVVHAPEASAISAQVLEEREIPTGTQRLLLRTRNSDRWARGDHGFFKNFVAITEDGARWLVEHDIRLVGIDSLSVGPYADPVPTHQILLGAGVIAVEGLNLSGITPGRYQFICLPLRLVDRDGAPARAILISEL
jgi:arylformamidase